MVVPLGPAATDALLEARGVVKSFPGVRALKGVDLDLAAGESHALLGENGAGKSTLIKILSGVYAPTEGTLRLGGEEIRLSSPAEAMARGIVTIHQELSLARHLSLAENVFLGVGKPQRRGGWIRWKEMEEQAAAILGRLGLSHDPRRRVRDLNAGEQQLVEIAKGLALRPRILILDEPTSALTAVEIDRLFAVIEDLRQEGISLLYVSHRLEEIFRITQRVTVFRDGEKVGTVPTTELDEGAVARMMTGREVSLVDRATFRAEAHIGEVLLEARDLSDEKLAGVRFDLRRGEILGLAGLMGSGRTEIGRRLVGARKGTGTLTLNGVPFHPRSPRDALREGVAYSTEDRKNDGLLLQQSVRHNLSLSVLREIARHGWFSQSEERQLAETAVEKYNVATAGLRKQVRFLSGGNQQKVMIARALACNLRLIILDEPTKGVDIGAKQEIYQLVRTLADGGIAVLFISSEISEVVDVCDRILLVHEGRITSTMNRAEANKERVLADLLEEGGHA